MTVRILAAEAKKHYPHSKHMRHQWIRKTKFLMETGRHVLFGGKPSWRAA